MIDHTLDVIEVHIGGMLFYIVEKLGDSGYKRIYSHNEYTDQASRKTIWLH